MPPKTRKKARLSQKNERRPLASLSENVFTPPSKKKRNEEELRKMHHSHQLQLLSLSNVKAKTKVRLLLAGLTNPSPKKSDKLTIF